MTDRRAQLAAFNKELEHRLASLDRGEHADPSTVRNHIKAKSQMPRAIGTEPTPPPTT